MPKMAEDRCSDIGRRRAVICMLLLLILVASAVGVIF